MFSYRQITSPRKSILLLFEIKLLPKYQIYKEIPEKMAWTQLSLLYSLFTLNITKHPEYYSIFNHIIQNDF